MNNESYEIFSEETDLAKRDKVFFEKYQHQIFEIYEAILNANKILLVSHQKPDGDTSGAAIAMAEMLTSFGKKCTLFSEDELSDEFHFLPKASEYIQKINPLDFDLAICFDGGTYKMLGLHEKYPQIFFSDYPLLNIDHHISNEIYGKWNLVETSDASTTIVVAKLFRALGWNLSPKIATPLLMGLYTDTGSLMHSNATAATHKEAAQMLRYGADLAKISSCIFQIKSVEKLRLWGRILSRIEQGVDGITTSFVKEADYVQTGATADDLTGVVDYLNAVPNAKFSLLITEKGEKVKGSLRTLRDDVDLTQIARNFGGGGHKKASGFTVPGKVVFERRWRILSESNEFPENLEKVGV